MSLADVGDLAGFSAAYISLIESGKRDPSVKVISQIASALGVPTPILVFLAADSSEIAGLEAKDREHLSALALATIRAL